MINTNELLFVVDEENTPLEPLPRSIVHQKQLWHRTTHIWIINDKTEVLCQKRSLHKDLSPGAWEPFFGGHILANENALINAVNEIREELGITLSAAAFNQLTIWKDEVYKEYQFITLVNWSGTIDDLVLEKDEVDEVKWIALHELKNIILSKSLGWSLPNYFDIIVDKLN